MSKRYGLLIDQERCIGCDACTVACKIENKGRFGYIKVITQDGPQKDVPSGVFPELKLIFKPILCNHCEFPPCVEACPVDAIRKRDDGIVIIDEISCTGCKSCSEVCPYDVIYFKENDIAQKCNLCASRIDEGLEPFCVLCCEGQAIFFGDLNDPNSSISKKITSGNSFRLKPEKGTHPAIYYLPPMPKREL